MQVTKRNGSKELINIDKINRAVERACDGLKDVSVSEIVLDAHLQMYEGIKTSDIDKALILSAKSKIEKEPNYSYVSSRLLLYSIYKEVFGRSIKEGDVENYYRDYFIINLKEMVSDGRINPYLLDKFDLHELANYLSIERDLQFKYYGLQTLYDRYFIHLNKIRKETPQAFWMRIAMGVSLKEKDPTKWAKKFYDLYSKFLCIPSSPTLFNSGTNYSQLSSCFLSTFEDSIDGIFGGIHQQSRLSKYAGGLAVDVGYIRGTGSYIKGTNGTSTGVVPWLKVINDMTIATNQGGRRPGVCAVYLEPWHIDIEDFLQIRKSTGDERRRAHELHTALWIPDLFMKYVEQDKDWYLFCPHECYQLHDSYCKKFDMVYKRYVELAKEGKIKNFKVIKAKELWKKIMRERSETGYPYPCFKDSANARYPNIHLGTVHNSNLCTEIIEHNIPTKYSDGEVVELGETAVCTLASVNLVALAPQGVFDYNLAAEVIELGIRHLDNVLENSKYPIKEAEKSSQLHRNIGLGRMGWQDLLHIKGIPYDSKEAVKLAGNISEFICYKSIEASSKLATERGKYKTYKGSNWDYGFLTHDLFNFYCQNTDRNEIAVETLDWNILRKKVGKYGLRNANLLATAPNATNAKIVGVSPSIDPGFSVLFVDSTLSGEFTVINEYFVQEMKKRGLWCLELIDAIKQTDGNLTNLKLPQDIKDIYKSVFDMNFYKVIDVNAEMSKWVDQAQSFNIYYAGNSMKELSDLHVYGWKKALKTLYYCRSKAASKVEKNTCSIEAKLKGETCISCEG